MVDKRTVRIDLRLYRIARKAPSFKGGNEVLADRRHFGLNAEQWEIFQAALDAPPRSMPRIEKLMQVPGFFE